MIEWASELETFRLLKAEEIKRAFRHGEGERSEKFERASAVVERATPPQPIC